MFLQSSRWHEIGAVAVLKEFAGRKVCLNSARVTWPWWSASGGRQAVNSPSATQEHPVTVNTVVGEQGS